MISAVVRAMAEARDRVDKSRWDWKSINGIFFR
jgi:hypothetical protein